MRERGEEQGSGARERARKPVVMSLEPDELPGLGDDAGADGGESFEEDPLLADLTAPQREAVLCTEGPLLILAAAGSGKTRVITRRIAHLVRSGVAPWRIMALTFTNKAAGEMRQRVLALLDPRGEGGDTEARRLRGLTVTTFHSLCARLLRRYADVAKLPGLKSDYTIYDSSDQSALMKQVITGLGLSTTNWPARSCLSAISGAKNELKDAAAFAAGATDFYTRTLAKIYESYEKGLRKANAVDFDDLLLLTVRALQTCREAREEAQARWTHLLIDEYQDTNRAQFILSTLLVRPGSAGAEANICVVGDPDQAIYGWRGADIRNILEFEQTWPGARVIALGENFRSTAPILATADALIQHNVVRKHKPLFTSSAGGENVEVTLCRDERHEANVVLDWMRARHDEDGLAWKDMAVFYRTNALSRVVEDAFRAAGAPYQIARGTAFYEREEVKDALAYLRVVANPADDVSLARIVNKPARGIGAASLAKLEGVAAERGEPMLEVLREAAGSSAFAEEAGVNARAASAVGKFVALLDEWTGQGTFMGGDVGGSLRTLVERVIKESGLEKLYASRAAKAGASAAGLDAEAPDEDRLGNLDELINSAAEFEEEFEPSNDPAMDVDLATGMAADPPLLQMLRAFLERVTLVSDADSVDPSQGAVTLMTLHAAKGLEFPAVAIVGLEEGLLPHSRARESDAQLEEERRLCFVGITRAMRRLLITAARTRTHRGFPERTVPSVFLDELPREHVTVIDQSAALWEDAGWSEESGGPMRRGSGAGGPAERRIVSDEEDALGGFAPGALVRHPQFGEGTILSLMRAGPNSRVQVRFRNAGVKTLVLQYARLERI